jgi:hypothetical protein
VTASRATTVAQYLRELPPERRRIIAAVRAVIRRNLPAGYQEAVGWGMIVYCVPLSLYPDTYNGQPMMYAALASQKNYCTVHLMAVYASPERLAALKDGFQKAGKKLDMGKACIRFRRLEDLPLEVIGAAIASVPLVRFKAYYEAARKGRAR